MRIVRTHVTTDWHLFHDRLVESGERPPDFQDRLIRHHTAMVKPWDTVINLGDVIFYQHPMLKSTLDSMPGTKILIMGNHDRKTRSWYCRNGFHYAAEMLVLGDVLLSHRPVDVLPSGIRLNVHGHLHRHREYENRRDFHRLLALEDTDYKPVLLESFK